MNEETDMEGKPMPDSTAEIFVVDDEPMLLELASFILEPLGRSLRVFRDPEEALNCFAKAERPPRLLITDYAMHNMNGMDLVERCKAVSPDLKVMLVSGTVDEDIYRDSSTKPDLFLPKPYQAKDLIESVKTLLGG
jgi:CheY-like chemotaxis protein